MKNKNLLYLLVLTLTGQFFFSCNSARQYEFSNRSQAYHTHEQYAKTSEKTEISETINTTEIPENFTASATDEPAPLAAQPLVNLKTAAPEKNVAPAVTADLENFKISRAEKKELRSALKQLKKIKANPSDQTAQPTVDIVELIFAIFLPPVGVLLHDGGITTRFWISLVLTLLFFFPGMIYALLVVTDSI